MSNISMVNGLPDIVSVQKRVYPLLYMGIVSTQPTRQPVATVYGLKRSVDTDDSSGWKPYKFRMDRWYSSVETIKLKTEISTEALSDMRSLGISELMITDHLADQIADDINKDILDKLDKISTVGDPISISSTALEFDKARELYSYIHHSIAELETQTGCTGTYVVAGGTAYGLLLASGMVRKIEGTNMSICDSGVFVANDKYSTTDYVTIGVKKKFGETELSSLVFSPYEINGEGGLSYQLVTTNPDSLNPVFGVMARYAITAAPLEDNASQRGANEIDWDNVTADMKTKLSVKRLINFV